MNTEKIKQLIDKYLEGETSLDEERQLREYFQQEDIPKELESYTDSFGYFDAISKDAESTDFDPFAKVEAEPSGKVTPIDHHGTDHAASARHQKLMWTLRIAAGFILLLIGFSAGQLLNNDENVSSQEVAALQQEIKQMKQALMYNGMYQQASAGERLSAVNISKQLPVNNNGLDQQITDILIYTMNNDKSVNVRMAAAEALFRFRSELQIQKALVNSLTQQEDPLMQITLIDMLVELKAKGALNEMNKLLMDTETRDIVKERLKAGIAELKT